jgi:hypothetical protein
MVGCEVYFWVRSVLRAIIAAFMRLTSLPLAVVPYELKETLANTICHGFDELFIEAASLT